MSITNYTELEAAVISYAYDDATDLSNQVSTFIQLAELRLQREIDAQELNTTVTLTLTAGQEQYTFPEDLKYVNYINVTLANGQRQSLERKQANYLQGVYWPDTTATTSSPKYWAWTGERTWMISGIPDAPLSYLLNYKRTLEPLSESNPTNFLIEVLPDALLAGSMIQAAIFKNDDDLYMKWRAMYAEALPGINIEYAATLTDENTPVRLLRVDNQQAP